MTFEVRTHLASIDVAGHGVVEYLGKDTRLYVSHQTGAIFGT